MECFAQRQLTSLVPKVSEALWERDPKIDRCRANAYQQGVCEPCDSRKTRGILKPEDAELLAAVCFAAGILSGLVALFIFFGFKPHSFSTFGTLLSGTTGVLWAFAGILIVYATFKTQQQEIVETNKRFQKERLEQTFFELVGLHHRIVEGITMLGARKQYFMGRRCFVDMYEKLKLAAHSKRHPTFEDVYENFFSAYKVYIGHYFRNLYHIVRYIDASDASDAEKMRFCKILRAQFSSIEILHLYYNAMTWYGENFVLYINVYHLLAQLDPTDKLRIKTPPTYHKSAFDDDIPFPRNTVIDPAELL